MTTTTTPNNVLRNVFGTDTRACVARIRSVFDQADSITYGSGFAWYDRAAEHVSALSRMHGITREHAAAVIAQLSPRTRWADNVAGAYAVCAGEPTRGLIGDNVARALAALGSADPIGTINGPKTRAFAANILGDWSRVTVDVWAARIALGKVQRVTGDTKTIERGMGRVGVYDAIERAYIIAAEHEHIEPAALQAITWIVIRNGRSN